MDMHFVRGRQSNLVKVGWENHTLQVEFKSGQRYHYGGVPSDVRDKLLRSPFPDKLFSQLVRGKYVSTKVYMPPSKPVPPPTAETYEIPF